jgi:hypothetical protein
MSLKWPLILENTRGLSKPFLPMNNRVSVYRRGFEPHNFPLRSHPSMLILGLPFDLLPYRAAMEIKPPPPIRRTMRYETAVFPACQGLTLQPYRVPFAGRDHRRFMLASFTANWLNLSILTSLPFSSGGRQRVFTNS